MRIVQVVPSLATGGAEHVAVDLAVVLRDFGHESHFISLGAGETDPALLARLQDGGVSVHLLDKRMGPDPTVIKDIRSAISRIAPQVVHTHLHALRYVLAGGAPGYLSIVHTVHNDPRREHSIAVLRHVDRMGYRRRVAGVVLSPSFVEPFLQIYGRPPAAVIPNGVPDVSRSQKPPRDDDGFRYGGCLRRETRASEAARRVAGGVRPRRQDVHGSPAPCPRR